MTSGAYMGIVGTYLMLFASINEIPVMNWAGLILATIGFFVTGYFEDRYKYRIERLEKKLEQEG